MTVTAPEPSKIRIRPEWIRIEDMRQLFGLTEFVTRRLISNGKIKTVKLRERGSARHLVLISYDSVAEFIAQLPAELPKEEDAQ